MKGMLLFLCSLFSLFLGNPDDDRADIKMVDKHTNSFASKMKQRGYYLCGSGGAMMDNIKKIHLGFDLKKKVEIDEARLRLVEMTEEFLEEINSDEKLRPYLDNYPFNHKNAELSIGFKDSKGFFFEEGVATVMIVGNKVFYSISKDRTSPLVTVLSETYSEAFEKVKQQKSHQTNNPEG